MPVIEGTSAVKTAQAEYDFAVEGGAVGTITLRAASGDVHGNTVPAGAVITGGYLDVETACASATGTMAIQAEAAGDILGASAAAALTAGRKDLAVDATGSTAAKTTVARSLQLVIATAAFTAGKFRVVVFYK